MRQRLRAVGGMAGAGRNLVLQRNPVPLHEMAVSLKNAAQRQDGLFAGNIVCMAGDENSGDAEGPAVLEILPEHFFGIAFLSL